MDRHLSGGDLVFNANPRQPIWGADVTGAPASYHEALNFIKDTERSFMGLDANVRARFDNDPQNFLNFVDDESNYEDAKKLGLLDPAYVAARDKLSGLSPEANSRPQEAGEFESGGNPTPQPKNAPRASKKED
jgi:phage internal scaffolding protein